MNLHLIGLEASGLSLALLSLYPCRLVHINTSANACSSPRIASSVSTQSLAYRRCALYDAAAVRDIFARIFCIGGVERRILIDGDEGERILCRVREP